MSVYAARVQQPVSFPHPQEALAEIEMGVQRTLRTTPLASKPRFLELLKKEWASVPEVELNPDTINFDEINKLYELRSQLLDWTVETGFLGFF